jgi:hypothetical protein
MEDHPGDTFGRRFLAFWGTAAAILAFGVVLWLGRKVFTPSDGEELDGGAAVARKEKLNLTQREQEKEINAWSENKEKGTVRMPTPAAFAFAAGELSGQKAAKSNVKTPEGMAAEAAAPKPAGAHDPNLSKFEGN